MVHCRNSQIVLMSHKTRVLKYLPWFFSNEQVVAWSNCNLLALSTVLWVAVRQILKLFNLYFYIILHPTKWTQPSVLSLTFEVWEPWVPNKN